MAEKRPARVARWSSRCLKWSSWESEGELMDLNMSKKGENEGKGNEGEGRAKLARRLVVPHGAS